MNVYGPYARADLDAQYDLRARHPDHPRRFERWAHASAEARTALRCDLDLRYGPAERQRLDLFHATSGAGPMPVLAFIHGGYWQAMDKADFGFLAPTFADAGIMTAILGYTLAPAATIHEIVGEIRAALVWLRRNVARFGGDADRLFVCGHSAGGHLTAMALASNWAAIDPALPPDLLRGGCAISGLYDLEPIRLCFLNRALGMEAADARAASPIYLPPPVSAPLLLSVGGGETEEFHRQQQALIRAWGDAGADLRPVEMPDHDHFSLMEALADPGGSLFEAVRRLVAGRGAPESGHGA